MLPSLFSSGNSAVVQCFEDNVPLVLNFGRILDVALRYRQQKIRLLTLISHKNVTKRLVLLEVTVCQWQTLAAIFESDQLYSKNELGPS